MVKNTWASPTETPAREADIPVPHTSILTDTQAFITKQRDALIQQRDSIFGQQHELPPSESAIPMVVEPGKDGYLWAINGKSWPHADEIRLTSGVRNRLVFDNRSMMGHPLHLHRHTFEITEIAGRPTSGVMKDVITVGRRSTAAIDFVANNPGLTLFHCHMQMHMDFGFMQLLEYAG